MRKNDSVDKRKTEEPGMIVPLESENKIIQIYHRNWIIKYHTKDKRYSLYVKKQIRNSHVSELEINQCTIEEKNLNSFYSL